MKKILILLFISFSSLIAQIGSVDVKNPVYSFLSRMSAMNILSGYNEFELPKTRTQVANYLKGVTEKKTELNSIDSKILDDFLVEFEYDINSTSYKYRSLLTGFSNYKPLSGNEKFLYYYIDSTRYSFFTNLYFVNKYVHNNDIEKDNSRAVNLVTYGGEMRGSFLKNYGFSIKGTNGTYFGSRSLAQTVGNLRYNYKFLYDKINEGGVDYFDETEGYLMADWNQFHLKIARDRVNIGYGSVKSIIGSNAPYFDYISLGFNYGVFSFSYFHAKLLGTKSVEIHPVEGDIVNLTEKYLAYHRFAFNFGKHLNLGFGEMIVYSRRALDLSYVNPFTYYKSIEHANQDRDNSMLFLDFKNNSLDGVNIYATILFDDIDFGKIGTSYFGNQMMLDAGAKILPIYKIIPLEINVQYIRVDPYVFTHRINDNNFTNNGFTMWDNLKPNSENYSIILSNQFHHRIGANISFMYTVHGANNTSASGEVLNNYGGDVSVGHRAGDSEYAKFLDGNLKYYRRYGIGVTAEPVNNWFISCDTFYENNFLGKKISNILSSITISIKI